MSKCKRRTRQDVNKTPCYNMIIIYSLIVYTDVIVQMFQYQHCIQNTLKKHISRFVQYKKESMLPKRFRKYRLIRNWKSFIYKTMHQLQKSPFFM